MLGGQCLSKKGILIWLLDSSPNGTCAFWLLDTIPLRSCGTPLPWGQFFIHWFLPYSFHSFCLLWACLQGLLCLICSSHTLKCSLMLYFMLFLQNTMLQQMHCCKRRCKASFPMEERCCVFPWTPEWINPLNSTFHGTSPNGEDPKRSNRIQGWWYLSTTVMSLCHSLPSWLPPLPFPYFSLFPTLLYPPIYW